MSVLPAQLVEDSDVGVHVIDVVGVGRVLADVPLLWFRALGGEHVTAVFGLIVHTVEACHLQTKKKKKNHSTTNMFLPSCNIFIINTNCWAQTKPWVSLLLSVAIVQLVHMYGNTVELYTCVAVRP